MKIRPEASGYAKISFLDETKAGKLLGPTRARFLCVRLSYFGGFMNPSLNHRPGNILFISWLGTAKKGGNNYM